MSNGVPRMLSMNAMPTATSSAITTPRSASSPSTTSSRPTAWLPLTSTTSSARTSRLRTASSADAASGTSRTSGTAGLAARSSRAAAGHRVADRDQHVDLDRGRELADAGVLRGRRVAELEHVADHRDGAPGGADPFERAERGRHRRRVGVVGVVDHERARRGVRCTSMRPGAGVTAASPAATSSKGTPRAKRDRGGERRVHDLVRAPHTEADGAGSPRRLQHERRPELGVELDPRRDHIGRRVDGELPRPTTPR